MTDYNPEYDNDGDGDVDRDDGDNNGDGRVDGSDTQDPALGLGGSQDDGMGGFYHAGQHYVPNGVGGYIAPDGSEIQSDGNGGYYYPDGSRAISDGMGGLYLPDGSRQVADSRGGFFDLGGSNPAPSEAESAGAPTSPAADFMDPIFGDQSQPSASPRSNRRQEQPMSTSAKLFTCGCLPFLALGLLVLTSAFCFLLIAIPGYMTGGMEGASPVSLGIFSCCCSSTLLVLVGLVFVFLRGQIKR